MLSAVVLGCSTLAPGCLVAQAPEYGPPQQRPPVVDSQNVDPSPYELLVFEEDSLPELINVPVRSEDAGEDLIGALYIDWKGPGQGAELVRTKPVPASSFDDTERRWTFSFKPGDGVETNCGHQLTLLLMHESNFDFDLFEPKANAAWDIASVTWQMNVEPDPAQPGVIQICSGAGASIN